MLTASYRLWQCNRLPIERSYLQLDLFASITDEDVINLTPSDLRRSAEDNETNIPILSEEWEFLLSLRVSRLRLLCKYYGDLQNVVNIVVVLRVSRCLLRDSQNWPLMCKCIQSEDGAQLRRINNEYIYWKNVKRADK